MDNDNQLCKSGQCVVGDILKSCHIRSLRAPLKMPLSHHTEQGHRQGSDDGHAALFDGHEFKSWSIFCENHIVANTFTPWTLLFFEGSFSSRRLLHLSKDDSEDNTLAMDIGQGTFFDVAKFPSCCTHTDGADG